MTTPRALADEIAAAARHAWDAVPDYLRRAKTQARWGQAVPEFSDGGAR